MEREGYCCEACGAFSGAWKTRMGIIEAWVTCPICLAPILVEAEDDEDLQYCRHLPRPKDGEGWSTARGRLTWRDMVRVYERIWAAGQHGTTSAMLAEDLGYSSGSDRRLDRALQLLRQAGFLSLFGRSWSVRREGE